MLPGDNDRLWPTVYQHGGRECCLGRPAIPLADTGERVEAFERDIEALVGCKAYVTSSATMAFQALLLALGVGPGWKVCFPAITFSGMPMQAFILGATVQFVDVDEDGFMVIPPDWKSGPKQIVVSTHIAGGVGSVARIRAQTRPSLVIEDCAHLYPGFRSRSYVAGACADSDYSIFSFYPTKCVATCEGGAITTAHDLPVMSARLHGFDRDAKYRHRSTGGPGGYDVVRPGTKAGMSDIAAAVAHVQLRRQSELQDLRRRAASWYIDRLSASPIQILQLKDRVAKQHSEHLMVVRFSSQAARDSAAARLRESMIASSLHFQALQTLTFWKHQIHEGKVEVFGDLRNSLSYSQCCLSVPLFPDISKAEVDRVCDVLLESSVEQVAAPEILMSR